MTKLLDKAIAEARKLPAERQDSLAAVMMSEIAAGLGPRGRAASRKPSRLDVLVAEADGDIAAGRTYPLEYPRRR